MLYHVRNEFRNCQYYCKTLKFCGIEIAMMIWDLYALNLLYVRNSNKSFGGYNHILHSSTKPERYKMFSYTAMLLKLRTLWDGATRAQRNLSPVVKNLNYPSLHHNIAPSLHHPLYHLVGCTGKYCTRCYKVLNFNNISV